MKHIKPYKIFESQEPQHPGFPTTEEEIHELCKKYYITNYTINDDLSIDVDGNVDLLEENLEYLPLKFNYVRGDFNCSINILTTLEGGPHTVGGYFFCTNNELTSLKGAPHTVSGSFFCTNNELTSLEGAPHTVDGSFGCFNNELTTLKGAPHTVNGSFGCFNNNLKSLKYLPSGINYQYTELHNNPIYTLIKTFIENDNVEQLLEEFNEYDIIRGDTVVLNRLEAFISDFDLEMPNLDEVKEYYEIV